VSTHRPSLITSQEHQPYKMGGKKSIKQIRLYDPQGNPYSACIGARIDSLLEVDYRYFLITPDSSENRVIQALSYYNPIIGTGKRNNLPTNHFHVKVDNPPHLRYASPRLDPPAIPEGQIPWWVPPGWIVSPLGNPLRPNHVDSVVGISNLVPPQTNED
jgi:hypothetical protein